MDDELLDAAAQPRCHECGVLMRDQPGGAFCPACGPAVHYLPAVPPALPDVPGFHGG